MSKTKELEKGIDIIRSAKHLSEEEKKKLIRNHEKYLN